MYMNKKHWKQRTNLTLQFRNIPMPVAPLTCWKTLTENVLVCFFISSTMSSSNSSHVSGAD